MPATVGCSHGVGYIEHASDDHVPDFTRQTTEMVECWEGLDSEFRNYDSEFRWQIEKGADVGSGGWRRGSGLVEIGTC